MGTWDYSAGLSDELWEFTPKNQNDKNQNITKSWCKINATSEYKPKARVFHAATYDASTGVQGTLYISGGSAKVIGMDDEGGSSFLKLCSMNDVWALDIEKKSWKQLSGNSKPQHQEMECKYSKATMTASRPLLAALVSLLLFCFRDF